MVVLWARPCDCQLRRDCFRSGRLLRVRPADRGATLRLFLHFKRARSGLHHRVDWRFVRDTAGYPAPFFVFEESGFGYISRGRGHEAGAGSYGGDARGV